MQVPDLSVQLDTGETVQLSCLYAEKPMALVFLRHLACMFCKEFVKELRSRPELNVVFVAASGVPEVKALKERLHSPHPFIADPDRVVYRAFQVERGTMSQMLNVHTFARGVQALAKGNWNGRPVSDARQLGGTFVVSPSGAVTWAHHSRDAADNAKVSDIAYQLERAAV
ncbi:MAG: AhpC/TSA family protein [Armatimonadetes bacterium]|nr:AhpC/TSA family protein [Armatimonadota bacterium]